MGWMGRIKNSAAQQASAESVNKAYNFLEIGEDELEVNMYGEVVETVPVDWWTGKRKDGLYICEKDFLNELDKYKEKKKITVRINSVGGDLYAGLAIANRMKELSAEITTIADALCASAAVAIYQVGKNRKVFKGSQIMIHEPSCYIYGRYDVQGIKKVEKQLEAGKKAIIKTYEERTGRSEADLERMLTEDSWMTGQEAIDEGFADELIEGDVKAEITEDKKTVVSNGVMFPVEAFASLPQNLRILKNNAGIGGMRPTTIEDQKKGGNESMTKQELKEKFPDVYNEIVQEANGGQAEAVSNAVKAERERIREIDEIANQVGDEKLIEEAKFGDNPMDAAQLALAAFRKQSSIGNAFLKGMRNDAETSGVNKVKPTPNSGTKTEEEQAAQDIEDGAALIAGIMGGEQK